MNFSKFVILLIIPVVASSSCRDIQDAMFNDEFCGLEKPAERFSCNLNFEYRDLVGDTKYFTYQGIEEVFEPCLSDKATGAMKAWIFRHCGSLTYYKLLVDGLEKFAGCMVRHKFFDYSDDAAKKLSSIPSTSIGGLGVTNRTRNIV